MNNEEKESFKKYKTTEIVEALPMTKGEGVTADVVLNCDPDEESTPGYIVRKKDGYAFWIEASEFEATYRPLEEE